MKASKVFLGMKLKESCEHTIIRNCLLDKGHGGIVDVYKRQVFDRFIVYNTSATIFHTA